MILTEFTNNPNNLRNLARNIYPDFYPNTSALWLKIKDQMQIPILTEMNSAMARGINSPVIKRSNIPNREPDKYRPDMLCHVLTMIGFPTDSFYIIRNLKIVQLLSGTRTDRRYYIRCGVISEADRKNLEKGEIPYYEYISRYAISGGLPLMETLEDRIHFVERATMTDGVDTLFRAVICSLLESKLPINKKMAESLHRNLGILATEITKSKVEAALEDIFPDRKLFQQFMSKSPDLSENRELSLFRKYFQFFGRPHWDGEQLVSLVTTHDALQAESMLKRLESMLINNLGKRYLKVLMDPSYRT